MKQLTFTLFFLFALNFANAQSHIDIANFNYGFSSGNKIENSNEKVDISESGATLRVPLKLKNGDAFILGFSAHKLNFGFTDSPSLDYYSIGLQAGYNKVWNEKLSTVFTLIPKINSDLKETNSKDFQLGGVILFTKVKNEKFKLKYGAYFNYELFGPFLVPLIGLDWRPNERISIYGTLPVSAVFAYKINDKFTGGFQFSSMTSTYLDNRFVPEMYLEKLNTEVFLFADFYLTKNILFQSKAGRSVGRHYQFYSTSDKADLTIGPVGIGDNRRQLNNDIKDNFTFQFSFIYRVKL